MTSPGDLVGALGAERPLLDQAHAEPGHGIAAQRGLVLLAVAEHGDRLVLGVVQRHPGRRDQVAVGRQPVDLGLDQRRALAGAGAGDGLR